MKKRKENRLANGNLLVHVLCVCLAVDCRPNWPGAVEPALVSSICSVVYVVQLIIRCEPAERCGWLLVLAGLLTQTESKAVLFEAEYEL